MKNSNCLLLTFGLLIFCVQDASSGGEPREECSLPARRGRCHPLIRRFYFNTKTRSCEQFIYSGCDGNKNNFFTWKQCRDTCLMSAPLPEKCNSLPGVRQCEVPSPRFFFDKTTGMCLFYASSGCGGNGNPFLSWNECLRECKPGGKGFLQPRHRSSDRRYWGSSWGFFGKH